MFIDERLGIRCRRFFNSFFMVRCKPTFNKSRENFLTWLYITLITDFRNWIKEIESEEISSMEKERLVPLFPIEQAIKLLNCFFKCFSPCINFINIYCYAANRVFCQGDFAILLYFVPILHITSVQIF